MQAASKSVPKTVNLGNLLRPETKRDDKPNIHVDQVVDTPFTAEELRAAWMEYAEQRKKYKAEYQLLCQPYELRERQVIVTLLSPVHESMLHNIRAGLTSFLREKLNNTLIQVTGILIRTEDQKKVIYTNREKFEYLAGKNPLLKELKDRLGLDTDF